MKKLHKWLTINFQNIIDYYLLGLTKEQKEYITNRVNRSTTIEDLDFIQEWSLQYPRYLPFIIKLEHQLLMKKRSLKNDSTKGI